MIPKTSSLSINWPFSASKNTKAPINLCGGEVRTSSSSASVLSPSIIPPYWVDFATNSWWRSSEIAISYFYMDFRVLSLRFSKTHRRDRKHKHIHGHRERGGVPPYDPPLSCCNRTSSRVIRKSATADITKKPVICANSIARLTQSTEQKWESERERMWGGISGTADGVEPIQRDDSTLRRRTGLCSHLPLIYI